MDDTNDVSGSGNGESGPGIGLQTSAATAFLLLTGQGKLANSEKGHRVYRTEWPYSIVQKGHRVDQESVQNGHTVLYRRAI